MKITKTNILTLILFTFAIITGAFKNYIMALVCAAYFVFLLYSY